MARLENVNTFFKSTTLKIKTFLQNQQWRGVLVFLFFVLLSFGFWVLQSMQEEYEVSIQIPIRYKNIPPDIAFTQTPPDQITARVKDKGSVLLNYTFGRLFASIEVNMNDSIGKEGILRIPRREIEADIYKQLMLTTSLVSFDPSVIEIPYSQRMKRTLPVEFNGDLQMSPGYALSGPITITPSNIDVFSSKSLLDTLKIVRTAYTEFRNVNKPITKTLALESLPGTEYQPGFVSVTFPVEEFTEKTLEIPVTFEGIPSSYNIRVFPSVIKVNASVPLSRYKELSEVDFAIIVTYQELEEHLGSMPIRLTKKPDWVENVTLIPDRIEFIFEQPVYD